MKPFQAVALDTRNFRDLNCKNAQGISGEKNSERAEYMRKA